MVVSTSDSPVIAAQHRYLRMISIVRPPRGVIQATPPSLSLLRIPQWKSIVFHKPAKDVVRQRRCISHDDFNQRPLLPLRRNNVSVWLISPTGRCQILSQDCVFFTRDRRDQGCFGVKEIE